MRLCAGLALLLVFAIGADARADTIYVLSQASATLTAIDGETDVVERTLVLSTTAPAGLALSPNKPLAFITHPDEKKISVVDLQSWSVTATFAYPGMPFGVVASADGKIFVADWSGNSIAEIDASTGKLERTVTVGRAPALLALTADGKRLVAANRKSDSMSVIDTKDFAVKATIGVGLAPFAVGVSPDGSRALVGNVQGGTASLIDLERFQVIATERTGAGPYGVAFAPDGGPALVVNQESGTVAFVSADLHPLAAPVKVGSYPEGVAITHDGRKAYVANWFSDDISVIDLVAAKEIGRIKCASGPRAISARQIIRTDSRM
jgi:YVTN family beta-propeller protein